MNICNVLQGVFVRADGGGGRGGREMEKVRDKGFEPCLSLSHAAMVVGGLLFLGPGYAAAFPFRRYLTWVSIWPFSV